ncbi:D-alanyl-D-alanine carboxypeptidase [Pradoshia sp. D12]|uniref:D-alanyl-D-alanine carboxypeptidase family protein n=1 Tax=Bacillaceae TaxID=186817 RepID=UPI00080AC355|nr:MULTISPECIES: D-alanyl-D-alanine carboxypeptidase family protein [Bacillaceae]OCA83633.1 D-alanyl-D-alanine carboxypeptidase [Bacillus sp. FJAT-27986]QFK71874.1 D-alanyl-D-alanine carboxypeptidase [Pradoshia sp. D12]TPF73669.1 D-alanyl-D-alanine carboxypeptidase [Bacillus sp. D12]
MKRYVSALLVVVFTLSMSVPSFAAEKTKTAELDLAPKTKSAILIEKDTGSVIYDKNKDERLSPASMTKIMTMLLIMEALDQKRITMEDKVRTSEYAASMGGSQIFLEPGEEMTVEQMLRGIAIGSGNDASVAMAEKIAGSEEEFVKRMNAKVQELGLKNTKFQNCTGLPTTDHYSSAFDMATIAKELLKHEEITNFTSLYESYLREDSDKKFWLVNTNKLVKFYPGVDGLKTGFTHQAGYCLTATAKKDNLRVIAVVFGAENPKERNSQITKMLDYAFANYQSRPVYKKEQPLALLKIEKGQQKKVSLVTNDSVSLLNKKGEDNVNIRPNIVLKKDVQAPIKKGDQLGVLKMMRDDKVISETPLIASKDVKRASWFDLFKRSFGMFTHTGDE